ncbi:MAG TPA: lipopolysaccharide biosynthesis protein [Mariniphaga sp.]|nr:lipopolysaccharide biosynthesis protein [Mariniphaga sp.]
MGERTLQQKTITGFKWSFLDNIWKTGGQFVIGIILTRLLSPEDFGLIGMITIFIVIGQSLTNSGFGQALIQKKNADSIDFSTVYYFNIVASLLIYFILFISAPLIANFYNQPQLVLLIKVICLSFVIDALGRIHLVYFEKNLDFKSQSIVGIISVLVAGVVSITMAYTGFGVWALVAHTVIKSLVTTILFWWISKWRPMLAFSRTSLKTLFGFGSKILLAGLMNSIFQNIYYLIIGRVFSAQSLGYYTRAAQFKDMPVLTLTSVIQKVTFPVFSEIQDDNEKLVSGYTRAIRTLSAVVLPLMGFIIIASEPLIDIVLGEKWLPVVPYLNLMAAYGWMHIIYVMNHQIITVKGRSDYYLQIKVIDKILIVISILLTYRYGIMAMIYGNMVVTILSYYIGNIYFNKVIDISLTYQLKNILPFLTSAALLVFSGMIIARFILNDYLYLAVSIPVAIVTYIGALKLMQVNELKLGIDLAKKTLVKFRG